MIYHSYILDSKLIYWGSAVPLCLWQTKYWSRQTTDGYIWHVRRVYAFNRWRIHPLILSNSVEITISDIVSAIYSYYNLLLEKIIRIFILSYNRGKLFYVYSSSRPDSIYALFTIIKFVGILLRTPNNPGIANSLLKYWIKGGICCTSCYYFVVGWSMQELLFSLEIMVSFEHQFENI